MQKMFDQQEKRFETLFSDQFETRFETLGNQLLTKGESVLSAVTTQLVSIQGKMAELEEHYLCMTDAQTKTKRTVYDLEQRLCDFSIEVKDKIGRLEAFSRRDNLSFSTSRSLATKALTLAQKNCWNVCITPCRTNSGLLMTSSVHTVLATTTTMATPNHNPS